MASTVLATAATATLAATPVRPMCTGSDGVSFVLRRAPTRCTLLPPNAAFADGANLASLRWRGWGRSSATATGVELGFHLPFSHIPVAVTAYRVRADRCGRGVRLYTRVRTASRFGSGVVRLPACSRD